jgi:hypothetical protein
MTIRICLIVAFATFWAFGQTIPGGAQTDLYFPQLADGGDSVQQWQTTFTFINPNSSEATIDLFIRDNGGFPLAIDLGNGPASDQTFTVPGNGSRVFRSSMASPTIQVGWASASSTVPIQATVAFRVFANGEAQNEVTAQSTLPTLRYTSFANPRLGIAIANAWIDIPVRVNLILRDKDGTLVGQQQVSIPGGGHTSFEVSHYFQDLPADFYGVLELQSGNPPQEDFVAWTLNYDRGIMSALPSGAADWPVSHWERIRLVYRRILDTAKRLSLLQYEPELWISDDTDEIDVYAVGGDVIQINTAISELLGDSQAELAFAIAHEMGHIIQAQSNYQNDNPEALEADADVRGAALVLQSGYDAYAAVGALAKLSMASTAGLITPAANAHHSFSTRRDNMYNTLSTMCATQRTACDAYKRVVHPRFPPGTPLRVGTRVHK